MNCEVCVWYGTVRRSVGWVEYARDPHHVRHELCRIHFEAAKEGNPKPMKTWDYTDHPSGVPDLKVLEGGR